MAKTTYTLHDETECKRDNMTLQYHYKSWSVKFACPVCGRSGRFNLNFLGRRRIICDGGGKFRKVI